MSERTSLVRSVCVREVLPEAELIGAADVAITGGCVEIGRCRPGDVWVCLPDRDLPTSAELSQLAAAGAALILTDRPLPRSPLPVALVDHALAAYGRICQALAGNPAKSLKLITIAGPTGTLVTSHMIASVLCEGGFPCGILGDQSQFDGWDWSNTFVPPTSPRVAAWLRQVATSGCTHGVIEASSAAMENSALAGLDWDIICFTGLTPSGDAQLATTVEAQGSQLLTQLVPEGFAILNADDDACLRVLEQVDGPVLSIGIDRMAELQATVLDEQLSEQTYLLSSGSMSLPVRTRLTGRRNVYHGLIAAAVGIAYGMELPEIVRGLEQIESVPGALERVECGQGFGVFVDQAATVEALAEVLNTLRPLVHGRLICVLGVGSECDKQRSSPVAQVAETLADVTVLTSRDAQQGLSERATRDAARGLAHPGQARIVAERRAAIDWALALAEPGDCVVLARAAPATDASPELVNDFADVTLAREWLFRNVRPRTTTRRAA